MTDLPPHTSAIIQPSSNEQNQRNQKDESCGKKRVRYPIGSFLLENLKERTPLKELTRLYLRTHEDKPTDRAFRKAANKLAEEGLILLERNEQLWLTPNTPSQSSNTGENGTSDGTNSMLGRNIARVHSTHKVKLSMKYAGEQPSDGLLHKFGRYGTAKQFIYHSGIHTIGAYKHKLVIWVRNPSGILTSEQQINAKAEGYKVLAEFARQHNLKLKGDLDKVVLSHHVVENDALNEELKELIKKYPQISERLGSHVCQTSHPGRTEHEGKAREDRIIRGDQVAIGLEKLTLDLPGQFEMLLELQKKNVELQSKNVNIDTRFASNLELHMGVLKDIKDAEQARAKYELERMNYEKENNETLKAIRKELEKRQDDGSM